MAECAIGVPIGLDILNVCADVPAVDRQLPENSFMTAIENIDALLAAEQPTDLLKLQPFDAQVEFKQSVEVLKPCDMVIKTGLTEAIQMVFGEGETIQIPKELDLDVDVDPLIGLSEGQLPTPPVIKVLSKELSAEDFKLYILPTISEEPVFENDVAAKIEKVVFEPAIKSLEKPESAPKYIEAIQSIIPKEVKQSDVFRAELIKEVPTLSEVEQNTNAKNNTFENPEVFSANNLEVSKTKDLEYSPPQKNLGKIVPETISEKAQIEPVANEIKNNFSAPLVSDVMISTTSMNEVKQEPVPTVAPRISVKAPQIIQDVAVNLKKAFDQNLDKVTIQVNPPSLGKIEVELKFSNDGRVNAILLADKAETYDLLKQNPQLLKEALTGQGINAETTDLSFNLRGEHEDKNNQPQKHNSIQKKSGGIDVITDTANYRQAPSVNSTKKVDIHA